MPNILSPVADPIPPDAAEILKRYPQRGGYLLTLFRTFANSVRFLEKGVPNLLDDKSPLPLRQREIVILRVTARLDCEYEWGVHAAAFARQAEFSPAHIRATRLRDPDAPCWTPQESLLIRAVDQLCDAGRISGATLEGFRDAWTLEQQLEILALCGAYHTVSFVANTAQLPPEAFGVRFPD
jgi:alkylhydroperoxidase family enzyme